MDSRTVPFPDGALAPVTASRRAALQRRATGRWSVAQRALAAVYGERVDPAWWQKVAVLLGRRAADRPDDLWVLDAEREGAPDWFQQPDRIGYSLYVDRFAGDLRGVADRVDYLDELGVTYLHLLPVFRRQPGASDGGFAVADHADVEPSLGSWADLQSLARRLRERGISLCLDFVVNHTAAAHRWAEAARRGDAKYQSYYLVYPSRTVPDVHEQALPQVFPITAPGNFTYVPELEGWVWTTFYPIQWDLNWANPEVFEEMLGVALQLANAGAEILRLDSAPFLWKRMGTTCKNQPEVHRILEALRALVGIVAPSVLLKAEAIVSPPHLTSYLGLGGPRQCHLAYHNTLMAGLWMALATGSTARLTSLLQEMPPIPKDTAWVTYLRCHDEIVWGAVTHDLDGATAESLCNRLSLFYAGNTSGSFSRGAAFQTAPNSPSRGSNGTLASLAGLEAALESSDGEAVETALRRIRLMYGVLLGFGGIPMLYMGDEIGVMNDWDEAEVREDGRWLQRSLFPWDRAGTRHDSRTVVGRLWRLLRAMIGRRVGTSSLHASIPTVPLDVDVPGLLALLRPGPEPVLVLANFAAQPSPFPTALPAPFDGPVDDLLDAGDGSSTAPMRAYAVRWLVPDDH
ncbi:MAG: hypothetical protein KTR31_14755 [Myxococcales bacterium]|nr:hypothetical protein [Myxococcales bacterium]